MEPWLEVEGLAKSFGDFAVDVSFACSQGEIVSILGPSGAGKSTVLRMLAGLVPPERGRMRLGGRDIGGLPARERGIGMVFQDFALFPHYDAARNVGYGLALRGMPAAERRRRAGELLDRFGLAGFGGRMPAGLSGGERQRVALARSLAVEPELMLFDEPLGSLDASLRLELRRELRLLQRELGYTSISVTHDQDDAMAVSDRVLVMRDGRMVQAGCPEEIWERPASGFVASFFGGANLLAVEEGGEGRALTAWGQLRCAGQAAAGDVLFIRAEHLRAVAAGAGADGPADVNRVAARVVDAEFQGHGYLAAVEPAGEGGSAAAGTRGTAVLRLWLPVRPRPGESLLVDLPAERLRPLPPD